MPCQQLGAQRPARGQLLGQGGEAGNVGNQDCSLHALLVGSDNLAVERVEASQEPRSQVGDQVSEEVSHARSRQGETPKI